MSSMSVIGALVVVSVVLFGVWAWVMSRLDQRRERRETGAAHYR